MYNNNVFMPLVNAADKPSVISRQLGLMVIILLIFALLAHRLFSIQIVNGVTYSKKVAEINISEKYLLPQRGLFTDVNGIQLVKNVEKFDLYISKSRYNNDGVFKVVEYLSSLNIKTDSLDYIISTLENLNSDFKLASNLSNEYAKSIQVDLEEYRFLYFKSGFKREYAFPLEFSHLIGYTSLSSANDIDKGYLNYEQVGKYKLEMQYEQDLKGIKGKSVNLGGVEVIEESIPGNSIQLTVDSKWQRSLYKIISKYADGSDAAGGAGIIIETSTGNIKSIVSYPGIDTNLIVNGIDSTTLDEYESSRRAPLIDKAISQASAPGSIYKLITSYSLLQNNFIDEDSNYFSNRCIALGSESNFCEFGKFFYGNMNVVRAIHKSSNLFFCNYMLINRSNGALEKIDESADVFGIGQKTDINIPGEIKGNKDSKEFRLNSMNAQWYDGDTCNLAIGQGATLVTPIQMVQLAAIVENGGVAYRPNIFASSFDASGRLIETSSPEVKIKIDFNEKNLDLIRSGMVNAARNPEGTVYYYLKATPGNLRVKTGTAEVYENINNQLVYKTHGWIIGSFDYNGQVYSFSYHLPFGGGGFYIAQVVKDFNECLFADFPSRCLD
jgi:penicillin-binding protein 2